MKNAVTLLEAAEINPPLPFSEVSKGYTQFYENDVLLAKITPCMENGKAAMVNGLSSLVGCGSTEYHVLRAREGTWPRYLFHSVWNEPFRKLAARNMTGSAGQKRVPRSFLESHKIPLPSLAEQKRIAAILDKADAIRRKLQQSLRLYDDFLRSTFLDMFGDPVTNPKGWPIATIRDLLTETAYGTSKKASESEGKFPCLRMNNITYSGGWDFKSLKYVDLDKHEQSKNLVHAGQLLFNRTNSKELVGKTAVYRRKEPMAFAGYLVRGIANEENDTEYISAFLNLPHGKAILQGMCKNIIGMANINAEEFKSIRIAKPPLKLQRQFAKIVISTEQKKESLLNFLKEAETLFSSLQQQAFRGEL
jgi:type I restriction enzyme S subunit